MNAPKWKNFTTWKEIKSYCENENFTVHGFTYNNTKMVISKNKNNFVLTIGNYDDYSIKTIINDLPLNIDNLIININKTTETKYLENIFTNLPFNLKKLSFDYKNSYLEEIDKDEASGKFNLLFGIKIPFGCKFMIRYENIDYNIEYINDKELEITGDAVIKRLKKVIKNDVFLNENSKLTFYKLKYRTYTNFSMETTQF